MKINEAYKDEVINFVARKIFYAMFWCSPEFVKEYWRWNGFELQDKNHDKKNTFTIKTRIY